VVLWFAIAPVVLVLYPGGGSIDEPNFKLIIDNLHRADIFHAVT
jgi:hypothetical protein